MFTPETFVLCSRFELFKAHCNFWLYWTSDTLQDCLGLNYFRPRQNLKNHDSPNVGDVIQCIVENQYLAYLVVTAKTEAPYHITVQQTYLSEAISHEVLSGRELTDQHPITAITGLLERLNNLEGRGRFLSDWDAETGLPTTNPAENPYPYKAGDYYIVSNISETINYRPDGEEYVHDVPSMTVETSDIAVNDTYMYDGTVWILRKDSEPKIPIDVALSLTSENPVQNKVITAALNTKQNILTAGANISISGTTISATYEYVLTKQKILTALGYTPYDSSNPDGFISGITSSDVITALGYTPYSTSNPAGYITDYTVTQTDVTTALGYTPQVPLVSGQNIKTINGQPILGNGDFEIPGIGFHPDMLSFIWSDHELTSPWWIRADTFNWNSGITYSNAYNHLVDDIENKTLQSETVGGVTVQFYLADDGHKICPANQESNVASIYSATGVAWYYILDTVNQQFKLPRTKFGFTGLRDTVGKYVEAGLPNITGTFGTEGDYTESGAFYVVADRQRGRNGNDNYARGVGFDASRSSSIYGNSTTVQSPATQMYLYFYAGQFSSVSTSDFEELTNRPLYNGRVMSHTTNIPEVKTTTWDGKQDTISDLATIRSGAEAGSTAVQPGDLSTVATTGSYNDLSNKPTIPTVPTNVSAFTNDADYQTSAQVNSAISTHNSSSSAHSDIRSEVASKSTVSVSATGTATAEVGYITIDGVEKKLAGGSGGGYHPDLLTFIWSDHQVNDIQWLRADTFSWQDGSVYSVAYQHLVADTTGKTLQSETIAGVTVQFYLASDGHKICPASQESNVASIYSATGVAWYYILDTTNERFKLPRTKFGFAGLRDTVGKYVEASIPNIKGGLYKRDSPLINESVGNAFRYVDGATGGYFGNSGASAINTIELNASLCSPVYKDGATTVQSPATQMYLYFYVGQYTQSAIEQTAGLNAELFNGKADLNLTNAASNASAAAKATIVGWGMPDYTAGVALSDITPSNSYTAPSNGYLFGTVYNGTLYVNGKIASYGDGTSYAFPATVVLAKNDVVTMSGNKFSRANFYPCKGVNQ